MVRALSGIYNYESISVVQNFCGEPYFTSLPRRRGATNAVARAQCIAPKGTKAERSASISRNMPTNASSADPRGTNWTSGPAPMGSAFTTRLSVSANISASKSPGFIAGNWPAPAEEAGQRRGARTPSDPRVSTSPGIPTDYLDRRSINYRDRSHLRPILERLSINAETWVDTVSCFGRWFHRVVGRLSSMSARAGRSGKFWFQGRRYSRLAFG